MTQSFYVTTPIYYVNDKPHIGHAYTTLLADVLTRCHRLTGDDSWFLTGTDEHGQKVQKAAENNGMTPQQQCDTTVVRFKDLWEKLNVAHDDFIRTTEPRHKTIVQKILQDLWERELIYKADWEGHYCTPCERFFTEKDLQDGTCCPECKRPTDAIVESNYFFKMSQYQDWLIEYIQTHPEFIQPSFRTNETLGFLKKPLADLCISRPKSRLSWGIELPFDQDYVCYVWFDALINYISAVGYGVDDAQFAKRWPCSLHLIGKDILTTHTVYWPTMLQAIGLPLPQTIFAHGWWLMGKDKMGKSMGNAVNPMELCERYGVDAFRYFTMAEMSLGQDAEFTESAFIRRYNSDLANDLGNLLSRVVKMIVKQFEGKIPAPAELEPFDLELRNETLSAVAEFAESIATFRLDRGLDSVMNAVRAGNRYLEKTAPWTLAKNGATTRLATVLYTAAEALRMVSGLLSPVMPGKMTELHRALGCATVPESLAAIGQWGMLTVGQSVQDGAPLFMRIDTTVTPVAPVAPPATPVKVEKKLVGLVEMIDIADFSKVSLKTARVIQAERVEGADKILKLRIEIGSEERQIVAGIAQFYTPEQVVGKTIVTVSNLKPAVIRGIESHGMLLAAKSGKELKLITVDGAIASGVSVG